MTSVRIQGGWRIQRPPSIGRGSPIAPQSLKLSRHHDTSLAMVATSRTASDVQDTHIFLSKIVRGAWGAFCMCCLLFLCAEMSASCSLFGFFSPLPLSSGSWMEEGHLTWQGRQTNKQTEGIKNREKQSR